MSAKKCFLCGTTLHGHATWVWAESGGRLAFHKAHPSCAAMLADGDDEEEDDDEGDGNDMDITGGDGSVGF